MHKFSTTTQENLSGPRYGKCPLLQREQPLLQRIYETTDFFPNCITAFALITETLDLFLSSDLASGFQSKKHMCHCSQQWFSFHNTKTAL